MNDSNSRAKRKSAPLLGWSALFLLASASSFWAFWGESKRFTKAGVAYPARPSAANVELSVAGTDHDCLKRDFVGLAQAGKHDVGRRRDWNRSLGGRDRGNFFLVYPGDDCGYAGSGRNPGLVGGGAIAEVGLVDCDRCSAVNRHRVGCRASVSS